MKNSYVGGWFSDVGNSIPVSYIACWSGSEWQNLSASSQGASVST